VDPEPSAAPPKTWLRRWASEPLLHFLLLGAALFALSAWGSSGGTSNRHVVINAGTIDYLGRQFAITWGRPPNAQELKLAIDEHVRQEIAGREALAMGLERDDTVIQRRLRQKLEFLLVQEAGDDAPSEAELEAWLVRNPTAFRVEPQLAFRQVFLRPGTQGAASQADPMGLLARLRRAGPDAVITQLGDPTQLPQEQTRMPAGDVARTFGVEFVDALTKLPLGEWSGPVESAFGRHIVLLRERSEGGAVELAEVRSLVLREVLAERQQAALQRMYEGLLARYSVRIEAPIDVQVEAPPNGNGNSNARALPSEPASAGGLRNAP